MIIGAEKSYCEKRTTETSSPRMPVKHFVTKANISEFPTCNDELNLLWPDISWIESQKKKILLPPGEDRWWMKGGYSRGVNQLSDVGFFRLKPIPQDLTQPTGSVDERCMKLIPGNPPKIPEPGQEMVDFFRRNGFMRPDHPPHFFSKEEEQYPQISDKMLDVGGDIVDGRKLPLDKTVVATWFLDKNNGESFTARCWSQPILQQYVLAIDSQTKKPQIWCYAMGDSGPGYAGSKPSRGFGGQIGENTRASYFPPLDSDYWSVGEEEEGKWAGYAFFTWKKVDNLDECAVRGCDVLHHAWQRAYSKVGSYIGLGDTMAEELDLAIDMDGSVKEDDGSFRMTGRDLEYTLAKYHEQRKDSSKFIDGRVSSILEHSQEDRSADLNRIRNLENKLDKVMEWSSKITDDHIVHLEKFAEKVHNLDQKVSSMKSDMNDLLRENKKMKKEIENTKKENLLVSRLAGVGLASCCVGLFGFFH